MTTSTYMTCPQRTTKAPHCPGRVRPSLLGPEAPSPTPISSKTLMLTPYTGGPLPSQHAPSPSADPAAQLCSLRPHRGAMLLVQGTLWVPRQPPLCPLTPGNEHPAPSPQGLLSPPHTRHSLWDRAGLTHLCWLCDTWLARKHCDPRGKTCSSHFRPLPQVPLRMWPLLGLL